MGHREGQEEALNPKLVCVEGERRARGTSGLGWTLHHILKPFNPPPRSILLSALYRDPLKRENTNEKGEKAAEEVL